MNAQNVFLEKEAYLPRTYVKRKKAAASAVLSRGHNRLVLSLGFIIWIAVFIAAFVFIELIELLVSGTGALNISGKMAFVQDVLMLEAALIFSLPVFHGYRILVSSVAEGKSPDLSLIFLPFSDFRMFINSFILSFLSSLSTIVPLTALPLVILPENPGLWVLLVVLMTPLWIYFTSVFRRMCILHSKSPVMGIKECGETAAAVSPRLRKEYRRCMRSFTGVLLLSAVTVLIYGIWQGFAYKNLASALYAEDMLEEYKISKDI